MSLTRRSHTLVTLVLSGLMMTAACGGKKGLFDKKDDNGNSGDSKTYTGPLACIQGVLVDGTTGAKIKLPSVETNKGTGVYALVQNEVIPAVAKTAAGDTDAKALDGEYSICGIPYENPYPVFAVVDGYESFQGYVTIPRLPHVEGYSTPYQESMHKTLEANIRLYKTGTVKRDLQVKIVHFGKPVAKATVEIGPTLANGAEATVAKDADRGFVSPSNVRTQLLSVVTNDQGLATIPAAEFILGGYYRYTVLPSEDGFALGLRKSSNVFVYGPAVGKQPEAPSYELNISLDNSEPQVALVSRSEDVNARGELTLYFNQPVSVYTPFMKRAAASLSGTATDIELQSAVTDENPIGNIDVVVDKSDARKVTLTPRFKAGKSALDSVKHSGLSVVYNGLTFRAAGREDNNEGERFYTVTNMAVKFYP